VEVMSIFGSHLAELIRGKSRPRLCSESEKRLSIPRPQTDQAKLV